MAILNGNELVVGIFDTNYNQLFSTAVSMKARVNPTSKMMEHPRESGSTIADHRVINLIEIELSMILRPEDYTSVHQQIYNAFLNGSLLIVQTRTGSYANMVIEKMPHDEDPDMYNTVSIAISLKEARIAQPKYVRLSVNTVSNPTDASTVQNGQTAPKQSIAIQGVKGLLSAITGGRL